MCRLTSAGETKPQSEASTIKGDASAPSEGFLHFDGVSAIEYKEALTKSILFYEGQRSGRLPSTQRVTWRGDSALTDGALDNVDLTGGYYDAGDNVKFNWPLAHTVTMLSWGAIEYGDQLAEAGELQHVREAIKWATDFLLKAAVGPTKLYTQVGDGNADHACWERPEDMDTPRTLYYIDASNPGTEPAADTGAALAAASIVFAEIDRNYSNRLRTKAVQMFDFADNYRSSYSRSCPFYCSFSGYNDELLWGAAWLYRATGTDRYLEFVENNTGLSQTMNEFSWDNKFAGAQIVLSKYYFEGRSSLQRFESDATWFACAYLPNNPRTSVRRTPAGFAFTRDNNNAQYTLAAAYLLSVYADYRTAANRTNISCEGTIYSSADIVAFAKSQLDYMLGENPLNMSYMTGFGSNYPHRIHHRGASIPSIFELPEKVECGEGYATYYETESPNPNVHEGAIVGGPNQQDEFADRRSDWDHLEPIVYMNSYTVGLLARTWNATE